MLRPINGSRLTGSDHSWEEDVERRPVVVELWDGIHENGQVPANVVHDEEEDADADRAHVHRHDLHDHREQHREPSLG